MQNRSGCNIAAFIIGAMPCAFFKRGCKGTFFFTYLQISVLSIGTNCALLQHFVNTTYYFACMPSFARRFPCFYIKITFFVHFSAQKLANFTFFVYICSRFSK